MDASVGQSDPGVLVYEQMNVSDAMEDSQDVKFWNIPRPCLCAFISKRRAYRSSHHTCPKWAVGSTSN